MSSKTKIPIPKVAQSRWGHPLVFAASIIGLVGSSAVYYVHIRARQRARSLFLEQSFFNEALELTRGYKPITEKLVEPLEPLQIDTTSKFNVLAALGARVSSIVKFLNLCMRN